jgi:hypothetical protein
MNIHTRAIRVLKSESVGTIDDEVVSDNVISQKGLFMKAIEDNDGVLNFKSANCNCGLSTPNTLRGCPVADRRRGMSAGCCSRNSSRSPTNSLA